MKSKYKHLLVLVITALTTGCASYQAQSLPILSPQSAPYSEKKEDIEISCKAFTENDCKRYLDRDVIAKGFQPIQISINNNSKRYLLFSKNNVDLTCADPSYVASEVHTSTVARSTAYGVGALFVWPLAIPAIVDGVKSSNSNQVLDRDFFEKTSFEQTITPYGHLNGLLFIPIELFRESFSITLVDKETKESIVFELNAVRN